MVDTIEAASYISGDFASCQINLLNMVPVESVPVDCFSHDRRMDSSHSFCIYQRTSDPCIEPHSQGH